jgi:hypothetical protein
MTRTEAIMELVRKLRNDGNEDYYAHRDAIEAAIQEMDSAFSDERKARELADEEIANLRNDLDRHIAIATAEASYAEVAAREVEFLCRELEILGYHKGAAISRDRVANAKRPLPEAPK